MRLATLSALLIFITFSPSIYSAFGQGADGYAPPLSRRALIVSPQESYLPSLRVIEVMDDLRSIGYAVDFVKDTNVTVQFMKTGLRGYDIIILRMLAYRFAAHPYFLLTGEPVAPSDLEKNKDDIIAERVDRSTGSVYGVSGAFFERYYNSTSFNGKLVYIMAAESYLTLSDSFRGRGADVFVGYTGPVYLNWGIGDTVTLYFFRALTMGMNVNDAFFLTMSHLRHAGSGSFVAPPFDTMFWVGNGTFRIKRP